MTGDEFKQWIKAMKAKNKRLLDEDLAEALGVSKNTLTNLKKRGGNTRDALACRALLKKLKPYP